MTTNKVYEAILANIPAGLHRKVFQVMLEHVGSEKRCRRDALIFKVFGYIPKNWKDSKEDRQLRRVIEELQTMRFPILSDSGPGGYYMPATEEERAAYVAELKSRRDKLTDKINALADSNMAWLDYSNFNQQALF